MVTDEKVEDLAIQLYEQSCSGSGTGRYTGQIPWVSRHPALKDTYRGIARQQLTGLSPAQQVTERRAAKL